MPLLASRSDSAASTDGHLATRPRSDTGSPPRLAVEPTPHAPKSRGRGMATRAVGQLTTWIFDLGARRVFVTVVADNNASIAVAQRAGFLLEGPTGEQSVWNGRRHEVLALAVAAEDWKRRP